MGDAVENNFLCCRLGPLNRVLLRVAVQKDVHFRHFGNPTAIDFAVKLDRELHGHSLPPLMLRGGRACSGAPMVVDQMATSRAFGGAKGISRQQSLFYAGMTIVNRERLAHEGPTADQLPCDNPRLTGERTLRTTRWYGLREPSVRKHTRRSTSHRTQRRTASIGGFSRAFGRVYECTIEVRRLRS